MGRDHVALVSGVEAVLLDMDGTLVDSDGAVERAWSTWATEHGVDPGAALAIAHGSPAETTLRHCCLRSVRWGSPSRPPGGSLCSMTTSPTSLRPRVPSGWLPSSSTTPAELVDRLEGGWADCAS